MQSAASEPICTFLDPPLHLRGKLRKARKAFQKDGESASPSRALQERSCAATPTWCRCACTAKHGAVAATCGCVAEAVVTLSWRLPNMEWSGAQLGPVGLSVQTRSFLLEAPEGGHRGRKTPEESESCEHLPRAEGSGLDNLRTCGSPEEKHRCPCLKLAKKSRLEAPRRRKKLSLRQLVS